jgi:hypothetical protein
MDYEDNLKKIYLTSRERLIAIIADSGVTVNRKQYSRTLLKQINSELRILRKRTNEWISLVCPKEYAKGIRTVNKYFRENGIPFTSAAEFAVIHKDAINILAREMSHHINSGFAKAGRRVQSYFDENDDILRQIGLERTAVGLATGETTLQLKQSLLDTLKENNFLSIKYQNGVEMPLDAYALLVARSTRREAVNAGTINQLTENGYDLVKISEHYPTCAICAQYQGRVFSISGEDGRFPHLDIAFNDGYFNIHPNCRHGVTPYIETLQTDAELRRDIEKSSNLEDLRDNKEIALYRQSQAANRRERAGLYQYERYKATLGDDAPDTLRKFKNIKDNPEKWTALQKLYRDKNYDERLLSKLVISGAVNRTGAEANKHAVQYYEAVRKMKYDYKAIAKNTGWSEKDILAVKEHIFINKHDLGGDKPEFFTPDYDMAVAWQRLMTEPDKIKESDIVLLEHEKLELWLIKKGNIQYEAHIQASQRYNYKNSLKKDGLIK